MSKYTVTLEKEHVGNEIIGYRRKEGVSVFEVVSVGRKWAIVRPLDSTLTMKVSRFSDDMKWFEYSSRYYEWLSVQKQRDSLRKHCSNLFWEARLSEEQVEKIHDILFPSSR